MTPQRLAQLVSFLRGLGLDPGAPGGPGTTALALAPIHEALCHSSLGGPLNHERLEFIGDAVLRLAATEFLRREHVDLRVGEQSSLRGQLVSDRWLTQLAEVSGLASVVRLGPMAGGDAAGRNTVMAECAEALLGAVYLAWGGPAGGLEPVIAWLTPHWRTIAAVVLADPHRQNWKSALQEWSQGQGFGLPQYSCKEISQSHGDPRRFYCQVFCAERQSSLSPNIEAFERKSHFLSNGQGWGGSRRQAEQAAARDYLQKIQDQQTTTGPAPS